MLSIFSQSTQQDREVLDQIDAALDELWPPMRFIADLEAVWPSLTAEQRKEIEESRTFRDQYHRHLAEDAVRRLEELASGLKAYKHRSFRQELVDFLRSWDGQEPDKIKILQGLLRNLHD